MPAGPTYRCLAHRFSIGASDPALHGLIDRLLAPFVDDGDPTVHYNVVEWDAPDITGFALYGNATLLRSVAEPHVALAHVLWEINQAAIASDHGSMLLHAAAAERDGRAVLLSAPSGAGKTTLVTGLVADGCGYLTDDVAVIGPGGGVVPYPKPIGFDLGARALIEGLAPPRPSEERYLGAHGFVTAEDLGARLGTSSELVAFVVPEYRPGAGTHLEPLTAGQAAAIAVEQSFPVDNERPMAWVDGIHALLDGVACYRLVVDDLAEAVATVRGRVWPEKPPGLRDEHAV